MNYELYAEMAGISVIVSVILLLQTVMSKYSEYMKKNFSILLSAAVLFGACDTVCGFMNSGTLEKSYPLLLLITILCLIFAIIFANFWLIYSVLYVRYEGELSKVVKIMSVIPGVLGFMGIAHATVSGQILVKQDGDSYEVGSIVTHVKGIVLACFLITLIIGLVTYIVSRNKSVRDRSFNLIVFSIVPIFSSIMQFKYHDKPYFSIGFMISCVLIYTFNVTAEREQRLIDSHNKIYSMQQGIIDALAIDFQLIARFDLDTGEYSILRISDSLKEVFNHFAEGKSFSEYIESIVNSVIYEGDKKQFQKSMERNYIESALSKSSVYFVNYRVNTKKGLVYYQVKMVRDTEAGDFTVIFGVHNVDDQIRREMRTQELLEDARVRAEAASVAKSEFLSRMSHDIRTPINGVMGMTEIAKKNIDNKEKVAECLSKMDDASHHLLSIVNDVLDMSKIESNKVVAEKKPLDIISLLDNCISIVYGQMADRKLEFVTDFSSVTRRYLIGDELHTRQVLINILSNAVKFTPDGGRINFIIEAADINEDSVKYRFIIADTGIGMKADFVEHIWEAFSQEDVGNRTNYKGTGLGMSITKRFVEMMGGDINVYSIYNIGTTFTVELTYEIDKELRSEDKKGKRENLIGARVLLVEDNELNMEIAEELLSAEGIEVYKAWNGRIGYEMFTKSEEGFFDAILMDIMMPEMDGHESARAIRGSNRSDSKSVPIIAMTANAFDDDVKKAFDAGMNAHLSKPIDFQKLFVTLGEFILK